MTGLTDLGKVEAGVLADHGRHIAGLDGADGALVGLEHVREVEDGAAVAAVHHHGESHALRQNQHKL